METWDLDILLQYMVKNYSNNDTLSLPQLQEKAILLRCIATTWRPRSKIGTLQARDIEFSYINEGSSTTQIVTGMTLRIRQPKESRSKVAKLGMISLSHLYPVRTTFEFVKKILRLRSELPADNTLFLTNLAQLEKIKTISSVTVANIVKRNMKAAGINTNIYGSHTLRSASSTKAFQLGTDIQKIKQHAHWSLEANTAERFYLKLSHQQADSTTINESAFSSITKNNTTSGVLPSSTLAFISISLTIFFFFFCN